MYSKLSIRRLVLHIKRPGQNFFSKSLYLTTRSISEKIDHTVLFQATMANFWSLKLNLCTYPFSKRAHHHFFAESSTPRTRRAHGVLRKKNDDNQIKLLLLKSFQLQLRQRILNFVFTKFLKQHSELVVRSSEELAYVYENLLILSCFYENVSHQIVKILCVFLLNLVFYVFFHKMVFVRNVTL